MPKSLERSGQNNSCARMPVPTRTQDLATGPSAVSLIASRGSGGSEVAAERIADEFGGSGSVGFCAFEQLAAEFGVESD